VAEISAEIVAEITAKITIDELIKLWMKTYPVFTIEIGLKIVSKKAGLYLPFDIRPKVVSKLLPFIYHCKTTKNKNALV